MGPLIMTHSSTKFSLNDFYAGLVMLKVAGKVIEVECFSSEQ